MGVLSIGGALVSVFVPQEVGPTKSSILVMDLEGIILDSKKFLKTFRQNIKRDEIKAVIIRVNSPGGVVGPSQAIYRELMIAREEHEKPIVASFGGLAASGAYYVAAAADKIVTNPGTLVGSIGVIMDFANLEDLYEWAKIKRFSLKTGKYKDTGADYRSMAPDEKEYLQDVIDEVLLQFKDAIVAGRKIPTQVVDENADGRIFSGARAVDLGFADELGNFSDAIDLVEEMTGLEGLDLFNPNDGKPPFLELLGELEGKISASSIQKIFRTHLLGKPLYLMPGASY